MRAIAMLRHGNILRLRGFYWGPDEMLLIYDLAANGSLANVFVKRKAGASPINLRWSARLHIARGVARGLAYLHDKKCVHDNVWPSNILLDADMEPLLADLGIHRLVRGAGDSTLKPAGLFGSKRSAKSLSPLSPSPIPANIFYLRGLFKKHYDLPTGHTQRHVIEYIATPSGDRE